MKMCYQIERRHILPDFCSGILSLVIFVHVLGMETARRKSPSGVRAAESGLFCRVIRLEITPPLSGA